MWDHNFPKGGNLEFIVVTLDKAYNAADISKVTVKKGWAYGSRH